MRETVHPFLQKHSGTAFPHRRGKEVHAKASSSRHRKARFCGFALSVKNLVSTGKLWSERCMEGRPASFLLVTGCCLHAVHDGRALRQLALHIDLLGCFVFALFVLGVDGCVWTGDRSGVHDGESDDGGKSEGDIDSGE